MAKVLNTPRDQCLDFGAVDATLGALDAFRHGDIQRGLAWLKLELPDSMQARREIVDYAEDSARSAEACETSVAPRFHHQMHQLADDFERAGL